MKDSVSRIIEAYLKEKDSSKKENKKESQDIRTPSPYVVPHSQLMEQFPYYTDQEVTDTHIQLNSPTNKQKPEHHLENLFVYPEKEWSNADYSGGNFMAPYENHTQRDFNRTDNNPMNLYDPLRGASDNSITDLNSRTSSTIDNFLSSNKFRKVSSMDLEEFFKVSDETLIHKSDKDLWRMVKDKEGNVYISRLFDEEEI